MPLLGLFVGDHLHLAMLPHYRDELICFRDFVQVLKSCGVARGKRFNLYTLVKDPFRRKLVSGVFAASFVARELDDYFACAGTSNTACVGSKIYELDIAP